MAEPKGANKQVLDGASALGLDIEIAHMSESTRTAEEAAAACEATVDQIVKSLVFQGADTGKPLLMLVSGANRVHEKRAVAYAGEKLKRPDAAFVRDVTGYAIGGIPPFAHAQPLTTFFDRHLLQFATVWAAAGTPNSVFAVAPDKLAEVTNATIIDLG